MATIAIDPLIVAKINILLAACAAGETGAGLSTEDILELFDSFFPESRVQPEQSTSYANIRIDPSKNSGSY